MDQELPDQEALIGESSSEGPSEGSWTLRGFCGLEVHHFVPLGLCFVTRIAVGLCCFWGRSRLLESVVDVSEYFIAATGSAMGLTVLILCAWVYTSPTLRAMLQRDLLNKGSLRYMRLFIRKLSPVARWVAFLPGLYAMFWILRIAFYPSVPMHIKQLHEPIWMYACLVVGMFAGSFMVLYLMSVFLLLPISVSLSVVDSIIQKIEAGGADLDWNRLQVEVHALDQELENMWSLREVGLQWLFVISSALMLALYGAHQAISENKMNAISFPIGVLTATSLLYALALVNKQCVAPFASPKSGKSILSSAYRFLTRDAGGKPMVDNMPEDQRNAHHRFVTYLAGAQIGVQVCGILVTSSWVLKTAANVGVVIPLVYRILVRVASQHEKTT